MITELVSSAIPVLRRGTLRAVFGLLVGSSLAGALAAGVAGIFALAGGPDPYGPAMIITLIGLSPVFLGLLAAGGFPAYALALEGTPTLGAVLRAGVRAVPGLCVLAVPGVVGLATFGGGVLLIVGVILGSSRARMEPWVAAILVGLVLVLSPACAYVWVRFFAAPACALVVDRVGLLEAFRRSDEAIRRRRWLLTAGVLLPLAPVIVMLPEKVANSVMSQALGSTTLFAIRLTALLVALVASGLLSLALPVVAYALTMERPIVALSSTDVP